jgi:hypothetical protein
MDTMKFLEGVAAFAFTIIIAVAVHQIFGFETIVVVLLCAILFKLTNK